jgi:antitoxin VapB
VALNIKNAEVEKLAAEVAAMAKETKTAAIRHALQERKMRLAAQHGRATNRLEKVMEFLEQEVWPSIPPELRGKKISKREREEILGIGPNGYPEP